MRGIAGDEGGRGLQHVGAGVKRLLAGLGVSDSAAYVAIVEAWGRIVGAEMAKHTAPLKLRNEVLWVLADDSAWASELRWSAQDIVEELEERLGTGRVQKVQVRVGR